ncbi:hypothetical protein MPC4_250033 [Methylocella tundrae]|uniref:Uncharacterized protein n=1 Tax=Methylocella tundrae TaxID=227605 RepID=A0A8B6M897_METTU|nr:hypothetical protein MPC1_4100005 [Methylocella tundrae]VTZ50525.1 hypothetical protein MPC4_250033 [Methylocella tundrae]
MLDIFHSMTEQYGIQAEDAAYLGRNPSDSVNFVILISSNS